jgi:peptidoglycan/LPS O-acetylase OafA/YrhL
VTERTAFFTATQEREEWVDWARGLAAVAVAFYHFNQAQPGTGWFGSLVSHGWLGVPVFFVLSGYCIQLAARRSQDWRRFLIARFFRIYPPYLASLALVALLIAWRIHATGFNDIVKPPQSIGDVALTLTLLIEPVTHVHALNWVYWTLTFEAAFYLVVTLAVVVPKAQLSVMLAITAASIVLAPSISQTPLPQGLFFLAHWGAFALGVGVAEFRSGKLRMGLALLALGGVAVCVQEESPAQLAALLTATFALTQGIRRLSLSGLRLPLLRRLGEISYSLYLLHVPVGIYFLRKFVADPGRSDAQAIVTDVVLLAACLACSLLFFRYVERPSIDVGRRIAGRLKTRVAISDGPTGSIAQRLTENSGARARDQVPPSGKVE